MVGTKIRAQCCRRHAKVVWLDFMLPMRLLHAALVQPGSFKTPQRRRSTRASSVQLERGLLINRQAVRDACPARCSLALPQHLPNASSVQLERSMRIDPLCVIIALLEKNNPVIRLSPRCAPFVLKDTSFTVPRGTVLFVSLVSTRIKTAQPRSRASFAQKGENFLPM